jgi:Outer membrane protein beta-barrel domain
MKKQSFFQLIFAFVALGFCQSVNAQKISLGVRGGVLINNMELSNSFGIEYDNKSVTGLQFSVPLEIAFGNMFSIQPEIMYGSHGFKLTYEESETDSGVTESETVESVIKINTLEIPVLAKFKLGSSKLKFNVFAGPSIGFGMNGEGKYKYSYAVTENGTVIEEEIERAVLVAKFVKDGYDENDLDEDEFPLRRTNLNLHFGVGVAYNIGKASLFIDARYILGLSDHFPDYKDAYPDEKDEAKSRRLGLSAGVMFPLK